MFDHHVLYSTYSLDGDIKPGANTMRILVGHGWYDVRSIATWNFDVAPWRDFPRTIAQLEITYADGTRETVATDGSWRQVVSPVGYDCIREGEVIGARHRNCPDLAAKPIPAIEVPAPKGTLVAENCPGSKVMREIAPKAIHAFSGGTYVVALCAVLPEGRRDAAPGARPFPRKTVRRHRVLRTVLSQGLHRHRPPQEAFLIPARDNTKNPRLRWARTVFL